MFSLLLIKFLSFNYRTRLIVGFSIVITFCLLVIIFCFNYSADKLAIYLPDNTNIYLWINWQKLQKSWAGTKLVDRILIENEVANINKHLFSKQLAQVCLFSKKEINCGLFIETIDSKKMEKELNDIGITYKKLSKKVFAVSNNSVWLNEINKKNYHLLAIWAQPLIWRTGDLTLYLQAPPTTFNQEAKILSLALTKKIKGTLLCGETDGSKILISNKCFWLTNLKQLKSNYNNEADLIISFDNLTKLINNWTLFLKNNSSDSDTINRLMQTLKNYYSIDNNSKIWKKIISAPQFLIIKKNENFSDNFFKKYNFIWKIKISNLSNDELAELEKTIYNLLAQEAPQEITIYLSDGTKVIELLPDISKIKKENDSDWTNIKNENGFQISYKYQNDILYLTNDIHWNFNFESKGEYLYLKKQLFPNLKIFNLISDFESIKYKKNIIEIY